MAIHACRALVSENIVWLQQALALLERTDDHSYAVCPQGFRPHRVGGHLRHIIDFYTCFLRGLETTRVDYDERVRDVTIEKSRTAAAAKLRLLIRCFEDNPHLRADFRLAVKLENVAPSEWLTSSVCRELQALSSHTIHHFALIALTLRLHGVSVDPAFGMSPSTLRYEARRYAPVSEEVA
jgi:hypothetical protein